MTAKKINNKRRRSKDVGPKKTNLNVKTIIILAVIAIVVIVAAVFLFTGNNGSTSNGNSNTNGDKNNTNGETNNTNGETNETLKNIIIGSWRYIDEQNKTLTWTFYDNDSLESEFFSLGGTHFTTWYRRNPLYNMVYFQGLQ